MTKLSHWLKKRKLSKAAFAPLVKRSRQTVDRWCKGEVTPDLRTIAVIEHLTNGEVTANDFMDGVPAGGGSDGNADEPGNPSRDAAA